MDTFMLILGFLVAFTFCIFILANMIGNKNQGEFIKENPRAQQLKKERLAAVATVAVAEKADPFASAVDKVDTPINGQTIYEGACMACHAVGVAGAPKLGDAGAWTARIAQGNEILYEHAIQGYQGEAGIMPAKGGRSDLSDEEVIAAVDYMTENSQ
ncbi:MAG: c-type cytochrome [Gammaproteobacteria bacterium]|nr:c-type cytochrome [Gammaproteobacteria bacterium]